jgi:hypothetical protein
VSPLFGNKEQKQAEIAAAKAEADRLIALTPAQLAVEVMPAFGPDGPKASQSYGINVLQVGIALMQNTPRGTSEMKELIEPIREALQALEHAELIVRNSGREGTWYKATRLGETALAEGSVQTYVEQRT